MNHTPRDIRIHISRYGRIYGPYRLDQALNLLDSGDLKKSDWAWCKEKAQEWTKLDQILDELNPEIERLVKCRKFAAKALELVEKEEFEYAFELIVGSNDPLLYETLMNGACIQSGELEMPGWVGWEEQNKTFFFQVLEKALPTKFIEMLRMGTKVIEHAYYEATESKFPVELLQFPNLRILRLYGNKFECIPHEISHFKKLEELNIENLGIEKLPDEFKELKDLKALNLSGNKFSKEDSNLEIIGELKGLRELNLSHCEMKSFSIPWVVNLPSLENLSLEENDLSGIKIENLLFNLSKAPSLTDLSLEGCGLAEIPEIKDGFTHLIRLDLSGNEIEKLPSFLSKLPKLKWINLQRNPVFAELNDDEDEEDEEEEWNEEQEEWEVEEDEQEYEFGLSTVQSREAHWSEGFQDDPYNPEDPIELSPDSQKKLVEFKEWIMKFQDSEFNREWTDQNIDELIAHDDPNLLTEIMRGCSLEKEGILITGVHFPFPHWAAELFASTCLQHDSGSEWAETGWGGQEKCKEAEKFHYFLLRLIPFLPQSRMIHSSLKLEHIISLDLCLPGTVPPEIGKYQNLRELSLSKNGLQSIPKEISTLSKLEILQLDENNISEFPVPLCNLKELKFLSITGNSLSQIGSEIDGMEALEVLDLSSNKLRELPMELANLSELRLLGLKNNLLDSLPPEIWTLHQLKHLWIGSNPIEELPPEIYSMKDLATLGICETFCFPEDSNWAMEREVFLSSNAKSMMIIKEKDPNLLRRMKKEITTWN